jgi:hypothetical protein
MWRAPVFQASISRSPKTVDHGLTMSGANAEEVLSRWPLDANVVP